MAVNKREILTSHQAQALLGKPNLIQGETEELYFNLWYAFVDEMKPERLSEWIVVNDLVQKRWEQFRLGRLSPALIEGARVNALKSLLEPYSNNFAMSIDDTPTAIARNYFAGDDKEKDKAVRYVEGCGITPDQIVALAMQVCGNGLLMFDRMDNNRQNSSRALRKDAERGAAAQGSVPDGASQFPK